MLSCIITYYNLLALRVSVNAHRLFLQIAVFKYTISYDTKFEIICIN